jgi:hypothetical protein
MKFLASSSGLSPVKRRLTCQFAFRRADIVVFRDSSTPSAKQTTTWPLSQPWRIAIKPWSPPLRSMNLRAAPENTQTQSPLADPLRCGTWSDEHPARCQSLAHTSTGQIIIIPYLWSRCRFLVRLHLSLALYLRSAQGPKQTSRPLPISQPEHSRALRVLCCCCRVIISTAPAYVNNMNLLPKTYAVSVSGVDSSCACSSLFFDMMCFYFTLPFNYM